MSAEGFALRRKIFGVGEVRLVILGVLSVTFCLNNPCISPGTCDATLSPGLVAIGRINQMRSAGASFEIFRHPDVKVTFTNISSILYVNGGESKTGANLIIAAKPQH